MKERGYIVVLNCACRKSGLAQIDSACVRLTWTVSTHVFREK